MGTYTDLLKLNKAATAPPKPAESPAEEHSPQTGEVATGAGTVWQKDAEAEIPNRQFATSPSGEIARTPSSQVAKSPNRKTQKRQVLHRGMDIYRDQLQSLSKIQFALWRRDDRKPSIRELVLLAIDNYIEKTKGELGEK
jgi:hypothetical protein